jgi:hypothetical protein
VRIGAAAPAHAGTGDDRARVQRRPVRNAGGAGRGNVFAVKRQEVGAADTQTAPPPTGGARVLVDSVAAGWDLGHHPHGGGAGANQFGVSVRGAVGYQELGGPLPTRIGASVPEPTETNLRSQLTGRPPPSQRSHGQVNGATAPVRLRPDGEEWWPATANRWTGTHVLVHWVEDGDEQEAKISREDRRG